jgi:hypothetical protein
MPNFDAPEYLGLLIEGPERADIPPQGLRDALKEIRGGLGKSGGLGQNQRHPVLRTQTPLGLRAVGDFLSEPDIGCHKVGSPCRQPLILFFVCLYPPPSPQAETQAYIPSQCWVWRITITAAIMRRCISM